MNILLTGGAGYIGSLLATELVNKGYKITVVDSKVSLNAYLKFVNSDSKSEQGYALKELSKTINARV